MLRSNNMKTSAEIIIVTGGPGSGKGTHCERLQREQGYHHISTGDVLRKLLKTSPDQDSPKIADIRRSMQRGDLLSDELMTEILADEIKKYPEAKKFLIDGYPRTLGQLELFEKTVKPCDKVLFFDTTEEIMISRLLNRSQIEHREDDNEKTIRHRIAVYKEKTLPVIEHLQKSRADKFVRIDTSGSLKETTAIVNQAVFSMFATARRANSFYRPGSQIIIAQHRAEYAYRPGN